jgi:hypothetical protein
MPGRTGVPPAGVATDRLQNRVNKYFDPTLGGLREAGQYATAGITNMLANPYELPSSIKTTMLKNVNKAYAGAAGRARAAGYASGSISGGEQGGIAQGALGNTEMARADAIADAEATYAKMATEIGDARIAQVGMPLLTQLSEEFDRAYGRAMTPQQKKKKRDWLKTVAGGLIATVGGFYTGGALTPVGLSIMESGNPGYETQYPEPL